MLRVPTIHCTTPGKTSVAKFIPAYELPLFRHNFRGIVNPLTGQAGVEVSDPPAGTDAEQLWHTLVSPQEELHRLRGMYSNDLVDRVFPDPADFYARVEEELERAATRHGIGRKVEVQAPRDLLDLIAVADPNVPEPRTAPVDPRMGAPDPDRKDIALALVSVGLTSVPLIAEATLSTLCSAKAVNPALAAALRATAQAQIAALKAPVAPLTPEEERAAALAGEATRAEQESKLAALATGAVVLD